MSVPSRDGRRPIRWWPAILIVGTATLFLLGMFLREDLAFQERNLTSIAVLLGAVVLLLVWWVAFSRVGARPRLFVLVIFLLLGITLTAMFRIRGVTGDLIPILEPRWAERPTSSPSEIVPRSETGAPQTELAVFRPDFPQFLGPNRTAVLDQPVLDPDWERSPPAIVWRREVGSAWSGFSIVGLRALTQEQHGDEELVTCYDTRDGSFLWAHADEARYGTTIAGEGPRCTPTVVSNRVYTLGATGTLNCLDLTTGTLHWQRDIAREANAEVPEWGYSGSPLVHQGRVLVSAGGSANRSLLSFEAATGRLEWSAGDAPASYSSPILAELDGVRQILMFNSQRITAHAADGGDVLWEYPWGVGHPHVAVPVIIGSNRVLFSSGYGVGSELLEITRIGEGKLSVQQLWRSRRMKAKFANLVAHDGYLYGLDDGILACLDLRDGSLKWKEGRYGHGQGLQVGELFLLMSERGELVLLRPTPDGPNELHRWRVFQRKTWNPIALAGELLLVRNDREAAAIRLAVR